MAEGWLHIRDLETIGSRCHTGKHCHIHTEGSRGGGARDEYAGVINTDSERHDECAPSLGHHDEFLLKSAQLQRLSDWPE